MTPGPWKVERVWSGKEDTYEVITNGVTRIAEFVRDEDAPLIAAAPELLEALEMVRELPRFEPDEPYGMAVIAAIEKAKGA